MPKLPRVSGKELIRLLNSLGYTLDRIRGSHYIFLNPGKGHIVVPVHGNRSISIGTLKAIIKKQLEWTEEKFSEVFHSQ